MGGLEFARVEPSKGGDDESATKAEFGWSAVAVVRIDRCWNSLDGGLADHGYGGSILQTLSAEAGDPYRKGISADIGNWGDCGEQIGLGQEAGCLVPDGSSGRLVDFGHIADCGFDHTEEAGRVVGILKARQLNWREEGFDRNVRTEGLDALGDAVGDGHCQLAEAVVGRFGVAGFLENLGAPSKELGRWFLCVQIGACMEDLLGGLGKAQSGASKLRRASGLGGYHVSSRVVYIDKSPVIETKGAKENGPCVRRG